MGVLWFAFAISQAFAQVVWPEAPEKWSAPVRIPALNDSGAVVWSATLTADEKTIYVDVGSRIAVSRRTEHGWAKPALLATPINVEGDLTEDPWVSGDGKTLFFRRFRGAYWVLFQTHWVDSLKNWGPVTDLGPNISNGGGTFGMLPDSAQHLLVFTRGGLPMTSSWDAESQSWNWPKWVDMWTTVGVDGGLYMTRDLKKLYYANYNGNDHNLIIQYHDSAWSQPMTLNLHAMLDTSANRDHQYQGFPWLSPDGHRLYFTSTYEGIQSLYMSRMLIDEHGDTVRTSISQGQELPGGIALYQNYPNPFNPATTIRFILHQRVRVVLAVFNTLGQKIAELVNGDLQAGEHVVQFHGQNLASGLYFNRLQSGAFTVTRTMLLVR